MVVSAVAAHWSSVHQLHPRPGLDQTLKVSGEVQSSQGHEPLNQDDGNELVKFMVVPEYQKWPTQGQRRPSTIGSLNAVSWPSPEILIQWVWGGVQESVCFK